MLRILWSGNVQEAADYLKSFVGEHPYSSVGWHCLGNAYRYQNEMEQAIDAYEFALAADGKHYEIYVDMSLAYELMGNQSEAAGTLLRARDIAPNRGMVYHQVAEIYGRAGDGDMAIYYLRKAVEEDPDNVRCLAALAITYMVVGEVDLALPLLKKARSLAPDDVEVLSAMAAYYDSIGNFKMASDYYDRVITSEDCTEVMCQRYVQFLYHYEVYDILIQFGEESLELYPDDPFYCTFLAAAYFHTNRYNRASQVLPHVAPMLLMEVCPELCEHPRLGPLVPQLDDNHDNTQVE